MWWKDKETPQVYYRTRYHQVVQVEANWSNFIWGSSKCNPEGSCNVFLSFTRSLMQLTSYDEMIALFILFNYMDTMVVAKNNCFFCASDKTWVLSDAWLNSSEFCSTIIWSCCFMVLIPWKTKEAIWFSKQEQLNKSFLYPTYLSGFQWHHWLWLKRPHSSQENYPILIFRAAFSDKIHYPTPYCLSIPWSLSSYPG